MTALVGNLSLGAAVLSVAAVLLACLAAARLDGRVCLLWARRGMVAIAAMLTISCAALLAALVSSDMRFAYVANETSHSLPTAYKIAAFWSGQEGSLLLWGWLVALMGAAATLGRRRLGAPGEAATIGTLAAVCGFFVALLVLAANPFRLTPGVIPSDGRGLNPMLQNPAMVAHPPLLFLGYAGFTVPFAIMLGGLVGRRSCAAWAAEMRRWALTAWLFLGSGIVVGAWWAYVELGWGGYWAWDPVENASLLPWLTGTALLHSSTIVTQQRGMFKGWTAALTAATFVLCIVGTYLTRSGVIDSVHAFGRSAVGAYFLAFLGVLVTVSLGVLVARRDLLRPRTRIENMLGREGMFLVAIVLLAAMAVATLIGTVFPLISGLFLSHPLTVGKGFYNTLVVPMGVVTVAVMALAPLLIYGRAAAGALGRGLIVPLAIAALVLAAGLALGLHNPMAMACLAVAVVGVSAMALSLAREVRSQGAQAGFGPILGTLRLIDANHRRYGGQLAHLGVLILVLGVAGSSLFSVNKTFTMHPGDSVRVGRYSLRLDQVRQVPADNYAAVEASLTLAAPDGYATTLTPQRRFYANAEDAANEVAIRTTWREDLYVVLAGWQDQGRTTAIQVFINPLTSWIWIGAILTAAAAVFCLLPRLMPRVRTGDATTPTSARSRCARALRPVNADWPGGLEEAAS